MWRQNSYSYYDWLTLIPKKKKFEATFGTLDGNYVKNRIHITRNIRCCNRITIYIYIFGLKFDRNCVQVTLKDNFYKIILYNNFFP